MEGELIFDRITGFTGFLGMVQIMVTHFSVMSPTGDYPYPQVQIQLIDNYQLAINNSQLIFNVDKANK